MQNKVTEEKIKSLMGRIWNIKPSEVPSDIEVSSTHDWDSLGHVDLMLELEKKFNISIDNETVTQLTSLKKIVAFINGTLNLK